MDEKMIWLPMWQRFFEEDVKFLGQLQSLGQETWLLKNSNLNKNIIYVDKFEPLN
jgi:hypothetical protein